MERLNVVAERHDNAVRLMLQGEHYLANNHLCGCIAQAKDCLLASSSRPSATLSSTTTTAKLEQTQDRLQTNDLPENRVWDHLPEAAKPQARHTSSDTCPQEPTRLERLFHPSYFLYNRPLYFSQAYTQCCEEEHEARLREDVAAIGSLLTATIIFNMALLNHLNAREEEEDIVSLHKARRLYLAVAKLTCRPRAEGWTSSTTEYGIGLAAMNNYSQICVQLGDEDKAQASAKLVQTSLIFRRPTSISESDLELILENAFSIAPMYREMRCSPAA